MKTIEYCSTVKYNDDIKLNLYLFSSLKYMINLIAVCFYDVKE
jgi:hypothetical protein